MHVQRSLLQLVRLKSSRNGHLICVRLCASVHYEQCAASEPSGTRAELAVKVLEAQAPACINKNALSRNMSELIWNLW